MQVMRQNPPMEPRPAATVVVARPGVGGPEVLLLRRAAASRFAPGYVVFPGGVVDPGDERRAAAWFGDPAEAVRACAVRELAEETGLVLTHHGIRRLANGESPDEALSASPPPPAALHEMGRWRAPEVLAVRFDAWFYATAAGADAVATPDMVEVDLAWWERPADALERHPLWTALMWPTYRTLEALAGCATVEDVVALEVPQDVPPPELLATYRPPESRG
jgi:8-oxo-dGTP pyrophosphatase MutT (NUDIX family)